MSRALLTRQFAGRAAESARPVGPPSRVGRTPPAPVRVIGIDPGSVRMGWGVVERRGQVLVRVASGVVRCGARPLPERLRMIYVAVSDACRLHAPTSAAIEGIFHQRNAQSALVLGHARGAALLALAHAGLAISEYAPALVKKAVAGGGRADKAQVEALVGVMLGFHDAAALDESDALAVAICHLHAPVADLHA